MGDVRATCGERIWVHAGRLDRTTLARPLDELDLPPRVLHACARLGLHSVADVLGTDEAEFQAQPGVGRRSWQRLVAVVRRVLFDLARDEGAATLAADAFAHPRTQRALARLGNPDGGLLLRADRAAVLALPHVDPLLYDQLRAAASDASTAGGKDGGLQELLAALDDDDRTLLAAAVGVPRGRPLPRSRLARSLGMTLEALEAREASCRRTLAERCPQVASNLRAAVDRELMAQDGVVRTDRAGPGTLHAMAAAGDAVAPLRLAAFLFPRELFLVGDALTGFDASTCRRVLQAVARLRHTLPRPLATVEAELTVGGLPCVPHGLLQWLLSQDGQFQVVFEPGVGEVLRRRRATVGNRIEQVLRAAGRALALPELLFRYRDRFRRARRSRLLDNLWAEPRFLEIGAGIWDLRERHVDQAELIEPEAARVRDLVCTVGGRHNVADLVDGGRPSERVLFLLRDCLRRDPALRNLGRGDFCPRSMRVSTEVEALQRALRSAMGELPLERFLDNQHRTARDLRTRLLRENHQFVEVAPDRIDLLSNYPFNSERLRTLLRTVELHLEQHDGFGRLSGALAAVEGAGLGGPFLTAHMLGDILRRHPRFEMLTDDLVALRSRGLRTWIQQRARDAIRRAANGLTAFEIQAEIPELAQFAACLEDVIIDDPMVQTDDGMHYRVV